MANITIFTGHYGSGKTEISVHAALQNGAGSTMVDLDIVNPYFRSAERTQELVKQGVKVICPTFANTAVDIPALPAEVLSIFEQTGPVIMDVGGDVTGATALGQYYPHFRRTGYHMLYVVNVFRPMSAAPEDIIEMLRAIESRSRLTIHALVNNANLGSETMPEHVMQGQEILSQVSDQTGLPIQYICGTQEILRNLPHTFRQQHEAQLYPILTRMRPEWMA